MRPRIRHVGPFLLKAKRALPAVHMSQSNRDRVEAALKRSNPSADPTASTPGGGGEELVNALTKLGFGRHHASEAAARCDAVDAAVDWLLLHVPESELPAKYDPRGKQLEVKVRAKPVPLRGWPPATEEEEAAATALVGAQKEAMGRLQEAGWPLAAALSAVQRPVDGVAGRVRAAVAQVVWEGAALGEGPQAAGPEAAAAAPTGEEEGELEEEVIAMEARDGAPRTPHRSHARGSLLHHRQRSAMRSSPQTSLGTRQILRAALRSRLNPLRPWPLMPSRNGGRDRWHPRHHRVGSPPPAPGLGELSPIPTLPAGPQSGPQATRAGGACGWALPRGAPGRGGVGTGLLLSLLVASIGGPYDRCVPATADRAHPTPQV